MPYDYKNADIEIIADSAEFVKIVEGKLNVFEAISNGILRIFGNAGKSVLFINAAL
jgi:putative sterol carrier protein